MSRNATPKQTPKRRILPRRGGGARSASTSWRDRFDAWRLHHRDSALDALRRMRTSPVGSLMTVMVIAIALALPAGVAVLLENAQALTRGWDGNAHLSVFLEQDVSNESQRELADAWTEREDVLRTTVITREEALAEFRELSGFGEVLDALPDNPLPPLVMVFPVDTGPAALERLRSNLQELPEVELAQLDIEWVQRLHAMIDLGNRLVGALTLALALAVVLVMVNTIRLGIESRRDEIVVVKVVGGTDGFVRRPFLYTGFWHGLAGGVVAVILVQGALWWLGNPMDRLMALYDSDYSLSGLGFVSALTLPLYAGGLGLIGAWLAVSRHLRDVDPNIL